MEQHSRIWVYGRDAMETAALAARLRPGERLAGRSDAARAPRDFPHAGLTAFMRAASRGETDWLLTPRASILARDPAQLRTLTQALHRYGVSVKSRSSPGSSSS